MMDFGWSWNGTLPLGIVCAWLGACGIESGGGGDATAGGTGTGMSTGETGGVSTGGPSNCPGGTATFVAGLQVPPPPPAPEPESGFDKREATCLVDDVSLRGETEVMSMTCDEAGGALDQPYVLSVRLPDLETLGVVPGDVLEVDWANWWGFEVGGGTRLAVTRGDAALLHAYREGLEGGLVEQCASPEDPPRALVTSWLAIQGSTLEEGGCDDLGTMGVRRPDGTVVYPGQVSSGSATDPTLVVEEARCTIQTGGAESWWFAAAFFATP